jgi:hypothetical protein
LLAVSVLFRHLSVMGFTRECRELVHPTRQAYYRV